MAHCEKKHTRKSYGEVAKAREKHKNHTLSITLDPAKRRMATPSTVVELPNIFCSRNEVEKEDH